MQQRRTRYHSRYGYVSGGGFSDIFKFLSNTISKVPPELISAGKKAATNVATSGISALGDRAGRELANTIAPKASRTAHVLDTSRTSRDEILNDLKLIQGDTPTNTTPVKDIHQQGFGRKKKIRGRGIKILQ